MIGAGAEEQRFGQTQGWNCATAWVGTACRTEMAVTTRATVAAKAFMVIMSVLYGTSGRGRHDGGQLFCKYWKEARA